jgi:uncharacterized membrane protein YphA (DoxX/SURF4 family)
LPAESRKRIEGEREAASKEAEKAQVAPGDWNKEDAVQEKAAARVVGTFRGELVLLRDGKQEKSQAIQPLTWKIADRLIEPRRSGSSLELVPPVRRPLGRWTVLDWADALVKYGLVAVGACLLAGFLTRSACLVGAGFLLLFFLAMPPLPGWPESPRTEGHYLYINKTLIELLALLLLATTRSGRWLGLDSLWPLFRRREPVGHAASVPTPRADGVPVQPAAPPPPTPTSPPKEISHGT